MELTRLLPLLASLQSLPRPVSPADPLPAPSLSLDRSYRVYLPGDQVHLTCSAPSNGLVSGYRFFLQNEQQEPSTVPHPNAGARLELIAEKGRAGSYTCAYWRQESSGEISSRNSNSISIIVRDSPAAPTLALSPPHQLYLSGESVQLTCSPPTGNEAVTRFQFSKEGKRIFPPVVPPGSSYSDVRNLKLKPGDSGSYTCRYWIHPTGREIQSLERPPVLITLTDSLPPPLITTDPLSGVVSEGVSLLITCTAPRDAGERRFLFYKDGIKFIPAETESEISTMESSTTSMNVSVLCIPWASLNNSREFTCGYEENVSGRWIPSPRSQAVDVTVTGTTSPQTRDILLITGGIFLLIAALAALISYCLKKNRVPKTPKSTERAEPGEHTKNLDPGHDSKGSNATVTGAEKMEQQGSEVTYALLALPASQAHTTQPKNKAKPAENEHVLYSEVVTTHTRKTAK